MIPFVAAGGLLIALAFLFGGYGVDPSVATSNTLFDLPEQGLLYYLGAVMMAVGGAAFGFLVPALSGYIAYALAGRPGIAPQRIRRWHGGRGRRRRLHRRPDHPVIAGFVAMWIGSFKVPRWLAGLMPVVIIRCSPPCSPVASCTSCSAVRSPPSPPASPGGSTASPGGLRDPARHRPRPHDVLRPRWPDQQGGLPVLRHRRPLREHRGRLPDRNPRSWQPEWSRRSRWHCPPRCGRSSTPSRNWRTAARPGCSVPPSSLRARSRSLAADILRVIPR